MNNLVWFKCPSNLTGNKQIKMMIDKEGARGYGSYLYIIELLSQQSTGKLTFDELRIFQQKGFSTRYMERIIRNYNLFIIDGETFASAYSFLGDEKTKKNSPKTTAHTTQSISQSIDQTIDKSTSQSSDQSTTQMIDQSITQTIAKSRNSRKGDKCQNINKLKQTKKCLPPYIKEKEIDKIENKKDITTPPIILPSVAEAAVEKEVAEIKSFDEGGGTNCPQQVKSWQMCIEEMSKDESWLEAVCMNSGYSALLKRNMKEAIDYFVKHAFT
ncbi:MAG: hypothetical protein Q4D56_05965, partial [Bacteroides sp.]|nr:hypothetical protein [Bacteroides sp.]